MPESAMRIASIQLRPFRLPLRQPLRTAQGTIGLREGWWIAVSDGEGRWGMGESAPLPGFAMEPWSECGGALERWRCDWTSRDVDERALRDDGLLLISPSLEGTPAAAHGLELALLDLAAQRAGMPLARWLEPGATGDVPVNATLGAEPPAEAARRAADSVAAGFRTLKIKVGDGALDADLARVRSVRESAGPTIRLRIDANGAWTREAAWDALRAFAPLGIEYAEQPVLATELESMVWLTEHSPVPIAADESACSSREAGRVLDTGAARVLVLKPMSLGGLVPTLGVARRAAARGVACVITTTIDSAIARTGALHAAAAVAALGSQYPERTEYAHGLATGAMLALDALDDAPAPRSGRLHIPEAPGLGLRDAYTRIFSAPWGTDGVGRNLDLPRD